MALGAAVALSGCTEAPPPMNSAEAIIAKGKEAVAKKLRDPSSAQWRSVHLSGGFAVCGEVNGRNAFGGYSGYEPFVFVDALYAPPGTSMNDWGGHLLSAPGLKLVDGTGGERLDVQGLIARYCR